MASDIRAELDYAEEPSIGSERCTVVGRALTCPVAAGLPPTAVTAVRLPDAIVGPTGTLATTWGSVSDLISLMR
jgi:hypothetical protein